MPRPVSKRYVRDEHPLLISCHQEAPALTAARASPGTRPSMDHAELALRAAWNFPAFRPAQFAAIEQVLARRDVLAVFPTGGGKSLTYQVPALIFPEGVTLVVSPLISLMKDQIDGLVARGVAAAYLNSTLSPSQMDERMAALERGELKLVYVSPERFDSPEFVNRIRNVPVALLAIDEAHCVSQWGHDFRPAYKRLGTHRALFPGVPLLAVTATATPRVRRDIVAFLDMRDPVVQVQGFDRPNLRWDVEHVRSEDAKLSGTLHALRSLDGTAVVYTSTKRTADAVAASLAEAGFEAASYHAGLSAKKRKQVQDAFMGDRLQVVVATCAFGMGVDKANVRLVVHWSIPGTMEALYQEGGRAGRDGLPARCLLFYSPGDRQTHEFLIAQTHPQRPTVEAVYAQLLELCNPDGILEVPPSEIRNRIGIATTGPVYSSLRVLADAGAIQYVTAHRQALHVTLHARPEQVSTVLGGSARKDDLLTLRALWLSMGGAALYRGSVIRRRFLEALPGGVDGITDALARMRADGLVSWHMEDLGVRLTGEYIPVEDLPVPWTELEARRRLELEKLACVERYATARGCRRKALLTYFDDSNTVVCGGCDFCSYAAAA
jgi:ATP-dependent DNA helicase RecQ